MKLLIAIWKWLKKKYTQLAISNNNRDTTCTGVSFDCSWNSRGWLAKEGVIAAIAQKTGKIKDIVR